MSKRSWTIQMLIEGGLIIVIAGFIFWTGAKANAVDEHETKIKDLQTEQKNLSKEMSTANREIIDRLIRIEERIQRRER